jgi:hypothetical protein
MQRNQNLFISYAHRDMAPTHWLDRLKVYLAPLRTSNVAIWDDSNIPPGAKWRQNIEVALTTADAAILLVGPGFFASEFITSVELPRFAADAVLRHKWESRADGARATLDGGPLVDAVTGIQRHLSDTLKAFAAQCKRRNDLVAAMTARLRIDNHLQYEKFFIRYYPKLTREERFEFDQIRALTEGPLVKGNQAILQTLEDHPALLDEMPMLVDLRQHLVFWLNKYERVFVKNPGMCLLYTGVEDRVPFPRDLGRAITAWLNESKVKGSKATSC